MTDQTTPGYAITGRCYCGSIIFKAEVEAQTVLYCHCDDCRRATGGPVAAFVALDENAVVFTPNAGKAVSAVPGVTRTFCPECGSSLTGRYDYLPGQVYISLGVVDQAGQLPPQLHAHEERRLSWLHIDDGLERIGSSARGEIK